MSTVSQIKKRFEDMQGFLSRNPEALRRLKLLKDDVNGIRTALASAEEKLEIAEAVKNAARERADKAEAALQDARIELQRLRDESESLKAQLVSRVDASSEEEMREHGGELNESQLKVIMKRIRKARRFCEKFTRRRHSYHFTDAVMEFQRADLRDGWGYDDLYLFGAMVAVLLRVEGSLVLKDKKGFEVVSDKARSIDETWSRHFVQWFVPKNCEDSGTRNVGGISVCNMKTDFELLESMECKGVTFHQ